MEIKCMNAISVGQFFPRLLLEFSLFGGKVGKQDNL